MDAKKSMLIFVVEDNLLFNKMVCEHLKKQNYTNLKSFVSGNECINAVMKGEHPDIVIQDYFLDDMNGLDVLKAVKKQSKKSEFIFLTANEDIEVAVNSMKYGALDYIIKEKGDVLARLTDKVNKVTKLILNKRKDRTTKIAMILLVLILFLIIVSGILLYVFGFIENG
jgi:DNA-binding NtrC family response regulator